MRHALVGGFGLFAGWLAGWLAGVQSESADVAFLRVIRTRQLARLNLDSISWSATKVLDGCKVSRVIECANCKAEGTSKNHVWACAPKELRKVRA